jgi:hypothetical protein
MDLLLSAPPEQQHVAEQDMQAHVNLCYYDYFG